MHHFVSVQFRIKVYFNLTEDIILDLFIKSRAYVSCKLFYASNSELLNSQRKTYHDCVREERGEHEQLKFILAY